MMGEPPAQTVPKGRGGVTLWDRRKPDRPGPSFAMA